MADDNKEVRPSYYRVKVKANFEGMVRDVELECFDLVVALGLDFFSGNALKYLWRCGKKAPDRAPDLRKASTYCLEAARRDDEDMPF